MRLRIEATDRGSIRPSSRRGVGTASPKRLQTRAARRQPAMRPGRRCDARRFRSPLRQGQARRAARPGLPPRFGLTFRPMTGARRRQGQVPAPVLFVLSALVLIAFALFPAVAGADSSNLQYSDAPPTATGGKGPAHDEAPAKSSKSLNGSNSPNTPGSKESHSPEEESTGSTQSKSDAVTGSSKGGQNGGPGSQGSQGGGPQGKSTANPQAGTQAAEPLSASKDGSGGSSPLVPILIAIAVLAAISIGAVMLRQRRQRGGTSAGSVSPKAS